MHSLPHLGAVAHNLSMAPLHSMSDGSDVTWNTLPNRFRKGGHPTATTARRRPQAHRDEREAGELIPVGVQVGPRAGIQLILLIDRRPAPKAPQPVHQVVKGLALLLWLRVLILLASSKQWSASSRPCHVKRRSLGQQRLHKSRFAFRGLTRNRRSATRQLETTSVGSSVPFPGTIVTNVQKETHAPGQLCAGNFRTVRMHQSAADYIP